jgi:hypothetical protein
MLVRDWRKPAPRRRLAAAGCVVLWGLLVCESASAQSDLNELLRSLIEAELQKRELNSPAPGATSPTRPGTTAAPAYGTVTREMQQARRILVDIAQETDRLSTQLNNDSVTIFELRPLIADVLKIRARTAVISQRAMQHHDHNLIVPDLQNLERDWRMLAHRLGQIRNLDRRAVDSINRLDGYATQLASVFGMQRQVDRTSLIRHIAALTADLGNLMEDIDMELVGKPERTQLLLDGRRIEQQARQVSYTVAERGDYDPVVADYKLFQEMWYPYAARLRPYQNRYLERSVRRIDETDNAILELLFLPRRSDPQQYLHLTEMLKKDVDDFFARAPLKLLIELPNAQMVIPVANEFYGYCDHFIDCVNRNEQPAELVAAFRYIESGWREFDNVFRPINSSAAQQVLSRIERSIVDLREAMQISSGYDSRAVLELAASLDNLAGHLDLDMRTWLNRRRDLTFRAQAQRDSAAFAAAAHHLHEGIVNNVPVQQLQRECDVLFTDWQRLQQHIEKCDTSERAHLQSVASQISPTLVELRTMLVTY